MSSPLLRTSERRDFLRCQMRWWWAWREGLRAKGSAPDALWFGTGVHIALAAWYCGPGTARGPHPAETWEEFASDELRAIKFERAVDDEIEAKYVDARALGRVMLEGYVNLYGRDEHKLIIAPEKTFRLRVPWPSDQNLYSDWQHEFQTRDRVYKPDQCRHCNERKDAKIHQPLFDYLGTFDDVWRDAETGQLLLDEHKTAAAITTGHLTLDPQAGSYWAVATRTLQQEGLIGPKERLAGIEYNFLRKSLPDDRPRDAEGYATNLPTKADYLTALEEHWRQTGTQSLMEDLRSAGKLKLEGLVQLAQANGLTVLGARSKVQPARLFERERVLRSRAERTTQLVRLQQEGLHMTAIKDGILPVLKNPDRSCNQGAMKCPFFEMCELHEAGGDWQAYKKAVYDVRDPYADHR